MKKRLGDAGFLSDDQRSIAKFEEKGMVYKGKNPKKKRVLRYQVDGKMISKGTKKCDFAMGLPDQEIIYLIELKGCDLKKAATQIYETMRQLKRPLGEAKIHGRAVCSRIQKPDLRSTHVVRLERELAKRKILHKFILVKV